MEKLEIKGDSIIWTVGKRNWLTDFTGLTKSLLTERHPYTNDTLKPSTCKKLGDTIKKLAGGWYLDHLNAAKSFETIGIKDLRTVKAGGKGKKLGNGKYATVYSLNGYAIKAIGHKFYNGLPRLDGKFEAKIMTILRNKIVYPMLSPCVVSMHKYTADKGTDSVVLEKMDKTFWRYLQQKTDARVVKGIILQVLFTLLTIQTVIPGFRHNDIKVDNVLLDVSKRDKDITLRYGKAFWTLPKDIPMAKLADFDYSSITSNCVNPKVGTSHSKSFGCSDASSKIYDIHLFLNSVYSYRANLSADITKWLTEQLAPRTRGVDTTEIKFGRLRKPAKWEQKMRPVRELLDDKLFSQLRRERATYPVWGLKNLDNI
jgi:hypothetical protein